MKWQYVDKAREGDHICYISDFTKMRRHYPSWNFTKNLDDIVRELVGGWGGTVSADLIVVLAEMTPAE